MFKFTFSNKKTISRNTTSFPITLADVKAVSLYFLQNPDDDSKDDYINNIIIPRIVNDWERSTNYLLLDQSVSAFVPDIQNINSKDLEIALSALNVRSVTQISYYPSCWSPNDAKTIADVSDYFFTNEILNEPKKLRFNCESVPKVLFKITNNLQADFLAGFLNNNFATLDSEIKNALAMQAAMAIDVKEGYCEDYYSQSIEDAYLKYALNKQLITFV